MDGGVVEGFTQIEFTCVQSRSVALDLRSGERRQKRSCSSIGRLADDKFESRLARKTVCAPGRLRSTLLRVQFVIKSIKRGQ